MISIALNTVSEYSIPRRFNQSTINIFYEAHCYFLIVQSLDQHDIDQCDLFLKLICISNSQRKRIYKVHFYFTSFPKALISMTLTRVSGVPKKNPYKKTNTTIPINLCSMGRIVILKALDTRHTTMARFLSTLR